MQGPWPLIQCGYGARQVQSVRSLSRVSSSGCSRPAAPHPGCSVLRAPAGRELLDREPLSADSPPHRAARVASDLIEKTVRGENDTQSGSIPAGVSLRSVVKGRGEGDSRAGILKRLPCNLFRMGGTAASKACGALSSIRGRREWAISEIPANSTLDRTAGSHSLAAAGQRERSASRALPRHCSREEKRQDNTRQEDSHAEHV
jgi:hypothetical protein